MDIYQPIAFDATPLGDTDDSRPPASLEFDDFPEYVDNTMRSTLINCEKKYEYSFLSNLAPVTRSLHLHAGGAFAAGLEAARLAFYVKGRPAEESIGSGIAALIAAWKDYDSGEETKSLERMCGAVEYYFSVWPLGNDYLVPWNAGQGEKGIEFTFAIPLPILHPQTGQPIFYVGRFDMLAEDRRGIIWAEDDKTASRLGETWGKQWTLDSQFTGYVWAARQFNVPVYGAAIRGISILKTMYGHAEQMVPRSPHLVDLWYWNLLRDVQRMIQIWKNKQNNPMLTARYALDKSMCGAYGGCAYEVLCNSANPEQWVPINFTHRDWDPLRRDPTQGPGLGTNR
jgi:hypothetical protein